MPLFTRELEKKREKAVSRFLKVMVKLKQLISKSVSLSGFGGGGVCGGPF